MSIELFKVVWTDGYDREHIAQRVVADNLDRSDAEVICEKLRASSHSESDWWVIKPQAAKIWRGMEEFV